MLSPVAFACCEALSLVVLVPYYKCASICHFSYFLYLTEFKGLAQEFLSSYLFCKWILMTCIFLVCCMLLEQLDSFFTQAVGMC